MINQEPDFGSLMPDTFSDLGDTSYGVAVDDYQAQMNDFNLRGPNAQFIASNASYDEESTSGGSGSGCCSALATCTAQEEALREAYDELVAEFNDLATDLAAACAESGAAITGSWSYGGNAYAQYTSGSCSFYVTHAYEEASASLSPVLESNVSGSGHPGYKLRKSKKTIGLYKQEKNPPFRVKALSGSDLLPTGEPACMQRTQRIEFKPLNNGVYGSGRDYIRSDGPEQEYGVFYRSTSSGINGNLRIGSLTKPAGEADFGLLEYGAGETDSPCGVKEPAIVFSTYTAGAGGSISGNTSQTTLTGEAGTSVTAIADSGYVFTSWSDGSTAASRGAEAQSSNLSVTANFTLK